MRLPMTRTNPELLRLLEAAKARGPMTAEEQREQAISFAYGQMMDCAPHITREEVAAVYDEMHPPCQGGKEG